MRRIHRAKIKSGGRACVPGGDLFLGETDAHSCKGRFAFNERIKCSQGCPTGLSGSQVLSLPLPGGGGPGLGLFQWSEVGEGLRSRRNSRASEPQEPRAESCRSLIGPAAQRPLGDLRGGGRGNVAGSSQMGCLAGFEPPPPARSLGARVQAKG